MKQVKWSVAVVIAIIFIIFVTVYGQSAVQQITGIAVSQTSTQWNNWKDAAAGTSGLTKGVGVVGMYVNNSGSFDMVPGDATNGFKAQITTNSTSGTGFYNIDKANLTTGSFNAAFGFTSKKVQLIAPSGNTDNVCVDFTGGTAACPAANTAGNFVLKAGTSIIYDDLAITSLSVIAASGTQEVQISTMH